MKIEFNNLDTDFVFIKFYQVNYKIDKIGLWGSLPGY